MEKASRVMYSIANIFTWILAIVSLAGIVLTILDLTDVFHLLPELTGYGVPGLVYCIIVFLVALITIAMVRRAKAKDSSKGWDLLFIVLGVLGSNVFYILGGIFGVLAVRRK